MAYITHNMNKNEELLVGLKMARGEAVATQKLAEDGVCLLRKVEEEKKASQAEACCLAKEKVVITAEKEKVEEKTAQLRRWLLQLRKRRYKTFGKGLPLKRMI